MTADHISAEQKAASDFFPASGTTAVGASALAVVTRRDDLARSIGTYGWDGGYRHVVVRRPQGGHDRRPHDPARLGIARSPRGQPRFLDLGPTRR